MKVMNTEVKDDFCLGLSNSQVLLFGPNHVCTTNHHDIYIHILHLSKHLVKWIYADFPFMYTWLMNGVSSPCVYHTCDASFFYLIVCEVHYKLCHIFCLIY